MPTSSMPSALPRYERYHFNQINDILKLIKSWRIRLNSLPILVVFFYRNLMGISDASAAMIMDLMLNCLSDDNVEVREMASSSLSGIVRVSQRQNIIPLKVISN